MTVESAQSLTHLGLGIFAYTFICVVLTIFVDLGKRITRFMVISGLTGALLMAFISGYLYYWHHFERGVP